MFINPLALLVSLAFPLLSIQAASTKKKNTNSWEFNNWNRYRSSEVIVGLNSPWSSGWKVPKHRGWLWAWSGSEKTNAGVKDPSGKSKDYVLRVKYNAHSRNPEGNLVGGLGFLAEPLVASKRSKQVTLEYSVYFPKSFDFVKGGKLPGIFGGSGECTGGEEINSCFTSRLMWREGGMGEVYSYLPHNKQRSDICDNKINICNSDYGYSLGRSLFKFKKGAWTKVRQVIDLNTPDKKNGRIRLYVNGVKKVDIPKVLIRTKSTPKTIGIMFHTFFGGSDNTWRTPNTQYSYFKNFKFNVK
ncbi:hypothetical protein BY458DRAFT_461424 [Sporodiniella umbellata]|nr:hypothetical protein BY458DRAFT_461424 [Sporodiniella umbellata]